MAAEGDICFSHQNILSYEYFNPIQSKMKIRILERVDLFTLFVNWEKEMFELQAEKAIVVCVSLCYMTQNGRARHIPNFLTKMQGRLKLQEVSNVS